jgi:predicted nucleotidyltransferase
MVEVLERTGKASERREEEIGAFCRALAERYRPVRITLFGSFASDSARADSDVDLLVEMRQVESALGTAAAIVRDIRPRFAVDLLVRTPRQVKERLRLGDPFMAEIISSGKVMYEAAHR